jgi:hypothetical protein
MKSQNLTLLGLLGLAIASSIRQGSMNEDDIYLVRRYKVIPQEASSTVFDDLEWFCDQFNRLPLPDGWNSHRLYELDDPGTDDVLSLFSRLNVDSMAAAVSLTGGYDLHEFMILSEEGGLWADEYSIDGVISNLDSFFRNVSQYVKLEVSRVKHENILSMKVNLQGIHFCVTSGRENIRDTQDFESLGLRFERKIRPLMNELFEYRVDLEVLEVTVPDLIRRIYRPLGRDKIRTF